MNPKITIITPSFNQAEFIEETIDSVLSQRYPNLEYIIIDGGSKDGSVEIIKKYEKYLKHWVSEKDQGQSDAINKGLKIASGDVVNWLNSDDYLEPGSLALIGEAFSDDSVNVLCARSRKFNENHEFISRGTEVYQESLEKTLGWARIDQPETWFRHSKVKQIGLLTEALHYLMDRDWWARYLLTFGLQGIQQLDEVIANFRLHAESKTMSQSQKFEQDHDFIFYHLALHNYQKEYAEYIRNTFEPSSANSTSNYTSSIINWSKVFSYYFLRKADTAYFNKNFALSRELLNQTDPSCLLKKDKKLYQALRFKSNSLTENIIKRIRT